MTERESRIPKGIYCYDENGICPSWKHLKTIRYHAFPDNEELQCERNCLECAGCKIIVTKCKYLNLVDRKQETLLWEQVKICGINCQGDKL